MLTGLVALLGTPASALCERPGQLANVMQDQPGPFPVDGELVLFHYLSDAPTDLPQMLKDGVPVTYQVEPIASGAVRVAPDTFQVGSTYEVAGSEFEVADLLDDAPPDPPVVDDLRRFNRKGSHGAVRRVEGMLVKSALDADAAWLEVEVAEQRDFSDAVRFGSLHPGLLLGRFDCGTTWLEYSAATHYRVRARQVDLSGNRSNWSDAVGTGCNSTPAPMGLFAMCAAMFGVRRTYRDRTRRSGLVRVGVGVRA